VRDEDAEERDEDRPQEQQEALVAAHVDGQRARSREHCGTGDQQSLRDARD
jgi:hypothetical protein